MSDGNAKTEIDSVRQELLTITADFTFEQLTEVAEAFRVGAQEAIDAIRARANTRLTPPAWATTHDDDDGAIRWERVEQVEIEPPFTIPGTPPGILDVVAMMADEVVVQDGSVTLVRGDVKIYVGEGDELMTLAQARTLANTILAVVDDIELAR